MYFFDDHHMSYSNDNRTPPADVAFRPAGAGLTLRGHCMRCNQWRLQAGGKGRPGPHWRCAVCVAAKQARAA